MQLTEEQRETIEAAANILWASDLAQKLMTIIAAHNAGAQVEPVGTLVVKMETHDMGQSLAPAPPPFKMALAYANKASEELPVGKYPIYIAAQPQPMTDAARDVPWDRRPTFDTKGVPRMTLRELVREHYQHYFSTDKAAAMAAEHIAEIERGEREGS